MKFSIFDEFDLFLTIHSAADSQKAGHKSKNKVTQFFYVGKLKDRCCCHKLLTKAFLPLCLLENSSGNDLEILKDTMC